MVRGLKWLTYRNTGASTIDAAKYVPDASPVGGFCPVRTGQSLLQTDERRRLVRVLMENSPLSHEVTKAWWLQPLEEMAARVQGCPAAWGGPFSNMGGFTDLSLNVAVHAVRMVRGMMLPPGAPPEEQAEQASGWICAVYWAGLLHHIEWLSQMEGAMVGGRAWYPGLNIPSEIWRVRPKAEKTASTLRGTYMKTQLLPVPGMIWLQRWPALSDSLLCFLVGHKSESGILNRIIDDARISCGLSKSAEADINAAGCSDSGVTESTLTKAHENTLLLSANNKDGDKESLISEAGSHIHPPVNADVYGNVKLESVLISAIGNNDYATQIADEDNVRQVMQSSTNDFLSMLDLMVESQPVQMMNLTSAVQGIRSEANCIAQTKQPENERIEESAGDSFLIWLKQSVSDGSLPANESDSILHILASFVFVVSPDCFYKYMSSSSAIIQDKNQLQKSFESLGIHHSRNGKGLYHYHKYDKPDKIGRYTKVSGYMIRCDILFKKGNCPLDSKWLSPRK